MRDERAACVPANGHLLPTDGARCTTITAPWEERRGGSRQVCPEDCKPLNIAPPAQCRRAHVHAPENTTNMQPDLRERIIKALRTPGRKADMLIERYLGFPNGEGGCLPYTESVETALTLLPANTHFLCGRSEEGMLFWCDVGFRPQVQAWGETLAAAVAGAVFAYRTHPDIAAAPAPHRTRDAH